LFWVLDSNIRVQPDTLNQLVNEYLQNGSKLIFSPIRGEGGNTLGGIIESAYFNHFLSGNVIMAWKMFRRPIVVGKSILIERNALERFGGFVYFKDYLAEDYMMGETFTQSKIPIATNYTWVTSVSNGATLASFFSRMARWAKLRYRLKFHYYLLEILLNPIALAAIIALTMSSKTGLLVFAASIGLKVMLEFISYLFLDTQSWRGLRVALLLPLAIVLKDILLLIVYFTPFFSCQVDWRGGKISIGKRTLISFSQESLLFDGV
jgi:ceramide glucosyltransferase